MYPLLPTHGALLAAEHSHGTFPDTPENSLHEPLTPVISLVIEVVVDRGLGVQLLNRLLDTRESIGQ